MCEHYNRNCSIISKCCNKKYACRHCHDEVEYFNNTDYKNSHKIDRFLIEEIVCNICNTRQNKSNKCIKCNIEFGKYYCSICNFWDISDKNIYHCDKCKICRVKEFEDIIHCEICNTCHRKDIVCNFKNIHSNCPVCLEDLFHSTKQTSSLNCGHCMHKSCLESYVKTNYKCPLCNKMIYDINKYIELEVNSTIMPSELQVDTEILCNECNKKSTVKFHIIAMKCNHCNSYNTRRS